MENEEVGQRVLEPAQFRISAGFQRVEEEEKANKLVLIKEKIAVIRDDDQNQEEFWALFLQILELIPNYGNIVQQMGRPPTAHAEFESESERRREYLNKFLEQIFTEKEKQEKVFTGLKEREREYIDYIQLMEKKLRRFEEAKEKSQDKFTTQKLHNGKIVRLEKNIKNQGAKIKPVEQEKHNNKQHKERARNMKHEPPISKQIKKEVQLMMNNDRRRMADFIIIAELGKGAFGVVLLVEEKSTGVKYAVKKVLS